MPISTSVVSCLSNLALSHLALSYPHVATESEGHQRYQKSRLQRARCERAILERQDTTDVEMGITSMVRSHLLPNLDIYPLPIFSDDMISLNGFCLLSECHYLALSHNQS